MRTVYLLGLAFATLFLVLNANASHQQILNKANHCRCRPNQSCWPSEKSWQTLGKQLKGRLTSPQSALSSCHKDSMSAECQRDLKAIRNPFYLSSRASETQSTGWLNAWQSAVSPYAVEAESTDDVVNAINFARKHHLRVAIKGTGHDYLGRSNAPDSLLIWTHKMRRIELLNNFKPQGCPKSTKPTKAVSVEAGTRWVEAYTEVTTKRQRYVQGGGCTSVGVAGGFTQGSGFGSFSKQYGTGAAGMLEAEVVTADGKRRIANACQNQDLFWALRGGGAGTFGVVTRMTLKTHSLPKHAGILKAEIKASSDNDYEKLIEAFIPFYRDTLNNPNWGEQFSLGPNNILTILMVSQGLSKKQIQKNFEPFTGWVKSHPERYAFETATIEVPPAKIWDVTFWEKHYPDFVVRDRRPEAPEGQFWWAGNSGEVYRYWYAYQSWWLPKYLLDKTHLNAFTNTLFEASRIATIGIHVNKGLAGASAEAIRRSRETSLHPRAFDAFALAIMATGSSDVLEDIEGHGLDSKTAHEKAAKISKSLKLLKRLAPQAGSYANEADYFEKDWQHTFWGAHYPKLFAIKQKYDPTGLFYCHHCVGSELWSSDGMCRLNWL